MESHFGWNAAKWKVKRKIDFINIISIVKGVVGMYGVDSTT